MKTTELGLQINNIAYSDKTVIQIPRDDKFLILEPKVGDRIYAIDGSLVSAGKPDEQVGYILNVYDTHVNMVIRIGEPYCPPEPEYKSIELTLEEDRELFHRCFTAMLNAESVRDGAIYDVKGTKSTRRHRKEMIRKLAEELLGEDVVIWVKC